MTGFENPFNKENIAGTVSGIGGAVGATVGGLLSNGYSSGAGGAISGLGSIASAIPGPYGAMAGAALSVVGGGVNALFGSKVNQEALNAANRDIGRLQNFTSDASSFDDIQGPEMFANIGSVYKGGPFSNAKKKNAALRRRAVEAYNFANRSVDNNMDNLVNDQLNGLSADFYADGGDLMSNGAAWDSGMTFINNGGSHEQNPYSGVPMGVDPQGTPNLVEEGEAIWNDYVFSKRLKVPKSFRDKYKLRGKDSISFAEAAEKFAEESKERPNDPISRAGRDALLTALQDQQELTKIKRQQREAKNRFNSMSPEEQLGVMQAAQQYAMQQQAMQGGPEGDVNNIEDNQGYSPNEVPQEDIQGVPMEEPQEYSLGGSLFANYFDGKDDSYIKRYNEDWFKNKMAQFGYTDFSFNNMFSNTDWRANFDYANRALAEWRKNRAKDLYISSRQKDYDNRVFQSGLYRRSADGNTLYKAEIYDNDSFAPYVDINGNRIVGSTYDTKSDEEKKNYHFDSQAKVGDFMRDYYGNIIYNPVNSIDYNNLNLDSEFEKQYDPTKDKLELAPDPEMEESAATKLRYAPAVGSGIASLTDILGITNKPDYGVASSIEAASSTTPRTIHYTPVGDYIGYNPLDRNYYLNQIRSSAAASRRALTNQSGGNRGTAMAGILASDYNTIGSIGKLAREAEEFNLGQRQKVSDFNRGTNQYNSQMMMNADKANQEAYMNADRSRISGLSTAAQLRASENARITASRSANLTNFINSLGQIGEEAYDINYRNYLINRGVLKDVRAYGGRIGRKRRGGK